MISHYARPAPRLLTGLLLLVSSLRAGAATAPFQESTASDEPATGDSGPIATADSPAESPATSESPPPSSAEPISPSPAKRTFYEDVVVKGELPSERATIKEPQSIGIVDRRDLQRSDGIFLEESLNLLPGVRVEARTAAGGQRITIRGYGNNTNFNGTGYKAYLNGIPITDGEGTTILDDIDVSLLGKIEVIKGPASSLYGAGIGGVVNMYTLRPQHGTTRFIEELVGGSLSLFRTNTRVEHGTDNTTVMVNYGHQHSDGYRIHSQSRKDYVLLSAEFDPSYRQSLSVYAAFNHSFDELAGQLTEDQFLSKQNIAEQAYLDNRGHVAIDSFRFGASHWYEFFPAVTNVTSAYVSGYQLDQPFAVGKTDNQAYNLGARTELNLRFGGPGLGLAGTTGGEIQETRAYKKSYGLVNNVLGGIRGDLEVNSVQANLFSQWDLLLPYEFTLTAGASLNFTHYNIRDRLANSANPTHLDGSGIRDFDPVLTPRVALLKAFGRDLSVYGQVSFGYTPPASSSVVIPQIGAVNTNLKPERGILYEVGTKGSLIEERLYYEVALFDLEVQDKLTPQAITDANGTVLYTITTNGGSQSNRGVEVAAKYNVISDPNGPLQLLKPFVSYTFSSFKYNDFKSDNNNNANTIDYSGKKVVGVPPHVLNIGVDAKSKWGIYLNGTFQFVDSEPLTYDNAHSAKSYSLLSAKLGYQTELEKHFRLDVFVGGNNLLGSLYYTMVFLNASYSGPPPNVYLPGSYNATFYGGVNLSYSL